MLYFEDMEVGSKAKFGCYEVTRDEAIAFASQYDPQPFHLDDEAAAQMYFGKISASGWHTCAMTMRMLVQYMEGEKRAGLGSPASTKYAGADPSIRGTGCGSRMRSSKRRRRRAGPIWAPTRPL